MNLPRHLAGQVEFRKDYFRDALLFLNVDRASKE
jgi:hypothetical protein